MDHFLLGVCICMCTHVCVLMWVLASTVEHSVTEMISSSTLFYLYLFFTKKSVFSSRFPSDVAELFSLLILITIYAVLSVVKLRVPFCWRTQLGSISLSGRLNSISMWGWSKIDLSSAISLTLNNFMKNQVNAGTTVHLNVNLKTRLSIEAVT